MSEFIIFLALSLVSLFSISSVVFTVILLTVLFASGILISFIKGNIRHD